ncbi:hypothetical protein B9479_005994 [Cryptococcus floricola]|uniref:Cation efflux protein transmembrane domain-containing protein n=1 Tax=Cryptococcus floricola TaxID=2591691 RepID=A0A5D3ARP5_9TREE|nr:hypothetical protein B9479_005994 [Cryptococcus floricola]
MANNRPSLIPSVPSPGSQGFSSSFPPSSTSLSAHFHNPTTPNPPSPDPTSPLLQTARHGRPRGMTFEEAHRGGIISDFQGSLLFETIPIEDGDIKKLPRKLRPYYEKLALLHAHYAEVDAILSGSITHNIALSFAPTSRTYIQRLGDLEEEVASPGLLRRDSYWRANGHRESDEQGGEAGERTGLVERDEMQKKVERRERIAKLALHINTIVNVLLVAFKAVAVLYSASISLTASLVDSALDLLSTAIILGTSLAMGAGGDSHKYPAGKRRFEPLGVLIFSVAMIASFVQVFIESFQRATGPGEGEEIDLGPLGLGTMLATIGIKSILWVWCSKIPSSGVQALAQDAENDVFFNIMSLAFPWIGSVLKWRLLDPIGGMVLSTYIIVEWIKTLHANFANLSGKAAPSDQITRVLYLVSRFNPVLEIADVECYHIGDDLIVEVDVILPRSSTLRYAHDVGETVQCVLESLDGVIRAYVHCDYSSANPSQHTARTPQAHPITRFSSPSSSSDSGSATPKAGQYLSQNGLSKMSGGGEGNGHGYGAVHEEPIEEAR